MRVPFVAAVSAGTIPDISYAGKFVTGGQRHADEAVGLSIIGQHGGATIAEWCVVMLACL
jgi:hypothetical protein